MGIDFHSKDVKATYTTRNADESWKEAVNSLVPIPNTSTAVDIGCGGGIYSKALADLGADKVMGVDFSETILEGARANCREYPNLTFRHGNAYNTGLENDGCDLVLERALIHHLEDLPGCFKEVYRILKDDGYYLVQDRTPDDCLLEGSNNHIRGYFFDLFPQLIEKETKRRYESKTVITALKEAGFRDIQEITLWETRKVYETKESLLNDLSERTGRSILHELTDEELKELVNHIDKMLDSSVNIIEKDRWTIWKAVK